jgi:hypothetical protein
VKSFHKSTIDGRVVTFADMDVRKKYLQIAITDRKGKIVRNSRFENNLKQIIRLLESTSSKEKKPVVFIELSPVWYSIYRHPTEETKET